MLNKTTWASIKVCTPANTLNWTGPSPKAKKRKRKLHVYAISYSFTQFSAIVTQLATFVYAIRHIFTQVATSTFLRN